MNKQLNTWIKGLSNKKPAIANFEAQQIKKLSSEKKIADFNAGDTISVEINIYEDGVFIRSQIFEGVCIAKENRGLCSGFVVRKISRSVAVEKKIPLHSNTLKSVKVLQKGKVRRAKLYYLRDLSGKKARIKNANIHKK